MLRVTFLDVLADHDVAEPPDIDARVAALALVVVPAVLAAVAEEDVTRKTRRLVAIDLTEPRVEEGAPSAERRLQTHAGLLLFQPRCPAVGDHHLRRSSEYDGTVRRPRRVEDSVDPREVMFVGIVRNDSADAARRFVEDFGLTYPNVIDDGSFARAYGVRGLPMTFVVAADGALVMTHVGPISESKLRAVVDDALRRTAPDAGTGD